MDSISKKFRVKFGREGLVKGLLFLLMCGVILSSGCGLGQERPKVVGVVLPHHLFVEKFIDDFYGVLAQQIKPERIILISPNHFDYGVRYIQTTTQTPKNEYDKMLDRDAINFLSERQSVFIENKDYDKEHGIFVHYPFIKKYFTHAKILPIIFKVGTPQEKLDKLIADLQQLDRKNTLVLASIDFTHYVGEEIATKNDDRTIAYLQKWSESLDLREDSAQIFSDLQFLAKSEKQKSDEAVAIDSPESMYVLLNFLNAENVHSFQFWKRTSVLSLTQIKDTDVNTSHIFAYFL